MNEIIKKMGVIGVDHLAVTAMDFRASCDEYLALPGAKLLRGPGFNERQQVQYAFIKTVEGFVIEVLGVVPGSPIEAHAKRGGGAYHLCYIVGDIDKAVAAVKSSGGRIIVDPVADVAFDDNPISFAFHPDLGLFELVQSSRGRLGGNISMVSSQQSAVPRQQIAQELAILLKRELDLACEQDAYAAAFGVNPHWDSLGHIRVVMAIENNFKVTVDSGDLYGLKSYQDILLFLEKRIGQDA